MESVYIEITDSCNLRCSFCPCGTRSQNGDTSESQRNFMPTPLFEKCIAGAQEIGAKNVFFHVLGEPTLHPGFVHYLKKLEQTTLKLTLTTNGTTIERTGRSILASPAVRQVNFSTHAYAELPREAAERYLQNVHDFCQLAAVERPDLYINLRLWNVGAAEATPWNRYMLGRIRETFGVDVTPGHFCSRHKSFNISRRIYLHEDTRFEWPGLDERREKVCSGDLSGAGYARGHLARRTGCRLLPGLQRTNHARKHSRNQPRRHSRSAPRPQTPRRICTKRAAPPIMQGVLVLQKVRQHQA